MPNRRHDEGIELPERRPMVVDAPSTRGKPVSPPLDVQFYIYIYHAEELLAERSRDRARET
jgi:hypothetical protein